MNNMSRKILSVFICAVLLVSLCSCGAKPTAQGETTSQTPEAQSDSSAASSEAAADVVSVAINGDFISDVELIKSEVESFKGGKLEVDEFGDITISMPKESYVLFLESRKVPVIDALDTSFEAVEFCKSYKVDDDMRNLEVVVDAEKYTGTVEQNDTVKVESSAIIGYQIFVDELFGLTIHIISDATGEEITSYTAF